MVERADLLDILKWSRKVKLPHLRQTIKMIICLVDRAGAKEYQHLNTRSLEQQELVKDKN